MDLTNNDLEELCEIARMLDRYETEQARQRFSRQGNPEEQMPFGAVEPRSEEPARNVRKTYVRQGGLGNRESMSGYYSAHDIKRYQCCHCKTVFTWSPNLECSDHGEIIDNLCADCRKELRKMRTNHPEM